MHATHPNLWHGFRSGRSQEQNCLEDASAGLSERRAAAEPPPEPVWEVDVIGFERNIVRNANLYEFQLGVGYWF
jgi:hypothetical protein